MDYGRYYELEGVDLWFVSKEQKKDNTGSQNELPPNGVWAHR